MLFSSRVVSVREALDSIVSIMDSSIQHKNQLCDSSDKTMLHRSELLPLHEEGDDISSSPRSASSFEKSGSASKVAQHLTANAKLETTEKRVGFHRRVRVKKVRTHRSYSAEERAACWYSEEETLLIKKACAQTLYFMMSTPSFTDNDEHCMRGLEVHIKGKAMKKKEVRKEVTQLVLEEQGLQNDWGVKDEERIRDSAILVSAGCLWRAQCYGREDAKAAKACYESR